MIIVHDGDLVFHNEILALVEKSWSTSIQIHQTEPGKTLGELRNLSMTLASGEYICQWDDDDRYHPQRLELQWLRLQEQQAEVCFLTDQLHYWEANHQLYWVNWNIEHYPYNLIPGTLMAKKDSLGQYPKMVRGEDSALVDNLLRHDVKITRLERHGWLYIYCYTGQNTFTEDHHQAIIKLKKYPGAYLVSEYSVLEQRLNEYGPSILPVNMPWEDDTLTINNLQE